MIAIRLNLTQRHLYYEGHVSVTSYMSLGCLWFIKLFIKLDKTDAISKTHYSYKMLYTLVHHSCCWICFTLIDYYIIIIMLFNLYHWGNSLTKDMVNVFVSYLSSFIRYEQCTDTALL